MVVGARQGKEPLPNALVAVDRIQELMDVDTSGDGVRIGALVTHAQLMTNPTIVAEYTALADSAALIGSPATRNVGTLGGNIMNASPAMDTGAPLMVLGAQVELRAVEGSRTLSLSELWTGPGTTSARPDELCVSVSLPPTRDRSGSAYVRLEYRRAMEIAVVGAAASVVLSDDGTISSGSVALTAVAPTIIEISEASSLMAGQAGEAAAHAVAEAASKAAEPISDLRASDAYRRHTVGVMAGRALVAAVRRAQGDQIPVPVNRAIGIGADE